ncbi:MAG: aldose 1-epimerase family protein [Kiritimatiellae bacterium]|nr:aldose 1-epimerase family protein [Kiritimatiellia bacterium]
MRMNTFKKSQVAPRVGRMEQLASIRRLTYEDGKGRGMRSLDFNNGSGLAFSVLPDRGMDIAQASYKGVSLAWLSCNGDVAPHFYNEDGIEWLRTWDGGLLTGCGLANVGGPNERDGESHGLHGRISHIPAEEVNTAAAWSEDGAAYTLRACGRMRQSRVFGEKMVCTREISTALGDNSITVRDTVENQGFAPAPFMLLYHINLGWPLIDEGVTLEAPEHKITPQTERAASGIAAWNQSSAPVPGFAEQVFYHDLPADNQGLAAMRVVNKRLGLQLEVSYRVAELPHLVQWKMMGQGEYVMGLEPANCYPEGQSRMAERGLLRHLEPGAQTATFLRLAVAPAK